MVIPETITTPKSLEHKFCSNSAMYLVKYTGNYKSKSNVSTLYQLHMIYFAVRLTNTIPGHINQY